MTTDLTKNHNLIYLAITTRKIQKIGKKEISASAKKKLNNLVKNHS